MKDKALFLFAAIGALWVVIEMYNFFRAPSADLVATVHHGEAVTPPDVYRHLRSLQALTEYESFVSALRLTPGKDGQADILGTVQGALGTYLTSVVPELRSGSDLPTFGYWSVDVSNRGSKPATAVTLTLPRARTALIVRQDGRSSFQDNRGARPDESLQSIDLETVNPGESLRVFAWTAFDLPVSLLLDSGVRLTSDAGAGSVLLYEPTSRLAYAIGKPIDFAYQHPFLALLWLAVVTGSWWVPRAFIRYQRMTKQT